MFIAWVIASIVLIGGISLVYALRLRRLTRNSITWLVLAGALSIAIVWHTVRLVPYLYDGAVSTSAPEPLSEIAGLGMFLLALIGLVLATPLFESAHKAQKALEETEQRYKHIFENAHVGIYRTTPDGRILVANPALVRMLGYSSFEELASRNLNLEGFGPGYSRQMFRQLVERPGGVRGLEAEWVRKDGSVIVIRENAVAVRDSKGRVLYYEGTVEDITERVVTERKLRESEHRHRQLVELAPIGIAVHRDGRGLFANRAAARIVDIGDVQKFVGANVFDFVHPDDRSAAKERVKTTLEKGEIVPFSVRYIRSDGQIVFAEGYNVPIEYEGKPAVMTVFQDVTERKRTEELERLLIRAQKMEALGRLAGGVAHDFNNLLTAIIGFASLLRENIPHGHPNRSLVEEIVKAGKRASALTAQLLSFGRCQVVEPRPLNLNNVIKELETLLARVLGEDVKIVVDYGRNLPLILADQGQIEQVLVNLAVNARDAMPRGGTLKIATSTVSLQEPLRVREEASLPKGDYVLLSVEDTGLGMDRETLVRIFEPFFTTKEVGAGTGLGLSTVYGIVKGCGGEIHVESEPGRGSRFDLYFPVSANQVPTVVDDSRTPTDNLVGSETVLLVEDEEALRVLASRVLEKFGYKVIAAHDGAQALETVRNAGEPISLVVTDVVMPQMSGVELVLSLRRLYPELPAIFVSGYSNAAMEWQNMPRAMFIQKPFDPEYFVGCVRRMLDLNKGQT